MKSHERTVAQVSTFPALNYFFRTTFQRVIRSQMKGNIFIFKIRPRNIIVMRVRRTLLFRPLLKYSPPTICVIYALCLLLQKKCSISNYDCRSIDSTIRCFHDQDILKRLYTVLRYISKCSVQTIISSLAIINKSLSLNMYILLVKLYFLPSVKLLHRVR